MEEKYVDNLLLLSKEEVQEYINQIGMEPGIPMYDKDSRNIERVAIEFLNLYILDKNIIKDILKKCNTMANGVFDAEKYNQACSEVIILYYLFLRAAETKRFVGMVYEPQVYRNTKKLEYSLGFKGKYNKDDLINVEIKTLACDPFIKNSLVKKIEDGKKIIKLYTSDKDEVQRIQEKYEDAVIIEKKDGYRQFNKNIKRIVEKFDGELLLPCRPYNIGFVVINRAASIEEFYSYLYSKEDGIIRKQDFGKLDALILFTLDAKMTVTLSNLYDQGYIQTILLNDTPEIREYLKLLKLNNYIQTDFEVDENVYKLGQRTYDELKMFARDGFLNIVRAEATEEELEAYLEFLKNGLPRGNSIY